jgi:ferredoxin
MGRLVIQPGIFSGEIPPTKSILMVLLEQRYRVHYSCRRGLCGQDLIHVISGWEHLNPIQDHEDGTLELLQAKGKPMRMACCAKIVGDGEVIVEVV